MKYQGKHTKFSPPDTCPCDRCHWTLDLGPDPDDFGQPYDFNSEGDLYKDVMDKYYCSYCFYDIKEEREEQG